jgi:FAD/FMN-containing dehydrogenase
MPPDAPADLALSTRGLARIVEVAPADLVATCERGSRSPRCSGRWRRRAAGSRSTRRAAGALAGIDRRHRHGRPAAVRLRPVRDHILGGTIVTGDGRVIKAGGNVVKNVAGYDLTKLQVGGFGAFGVVTQLHLRLRALPAVRVTLLARGGRDSLTRQARALRDAQLTAAALELCSPGWRPTPSGCSPWSSRAPRPRSQPRASAPGR